MDTEGGSSMAETGSVKEDDQEIETTEEGDNDVDKEVVDQSDSSAEDSMSASESDERSVS